MTKAEREHLARVIDLGCIVCRNTGRGKSPAEVHHIRIGVGKGQRAGHFDVLPLCAPHHRIGSYGIAFHAGKEKWQALYGSEQDLLAQVRRDLGVGIEA